VSKKRKKDVSVSKHGMECVKKLKGTSSRLLRKEFPSLKTRFRVQRVNEFIMNIQIKSCLKGAKEAEGIAVIIDVFRASNTMIAMLEQGIEFIIAVGDLEQAYALKKEHPDYLLFGERKGIPPEGFDYGNSPTQTLKLNLHDKRAIITTSAGSQGVVNARKADEILIGSFANAHAVVDYIKQKNPEKVSLIPIGFEANKKAEEDEQCALYMKELLEERIPNFEAMKKIILRSDGANRLRRLGQQDDLEFALKLDIYKIIPKVFEERGTLIVRLCPLNSWKN